MGLHYRAYGIKHLKFHAYFTTNHIDKIKIVSGFWSSSKDHTLSSVLSFQSYLFKNCIIQDGLLSTEKDLPAVFLGIHTIWTSSADRGSSHMTDFLWLCSDQNGPAEYHLFSKFCPCVFVELKIVSNFHTNPLSDSLVRLISSSWLDCVIWPKLNYLLPYFSSP